VRLKCPLGFLERQPTLDAEEFEELTERNRNRYGGVPQKLNWTPAESRAGEPAPKIHEIQPSLKERNSSQSQHTPMMPEATSDEAPEAPQVSTIPPKAQKAVATDEALRELGKGGRNHRYLQSLIRELANQNGIRATIEAPLPSGGQVDVLLERDGMTAAIEISVSTPVAYEIQNVRKCLDARHSCVGVVLAKSKKAQKNYIAAITESLSEAEREHVSFLIPEDLPDFIQSLIPPTAQVERIVRGYRVKGSIDAPNPNEGKIRSAAIAKLINTAMSRPEEK
jgi:hypothetical protein